MAASRNTARKSPKKTAPRGNPARVRVAPVAPPKPVTLGDWIGAARLRTLPLAVSPVIAGTGAALVVDDRFHWALALACLVVAVALQIGVNFANDYSDGIRGTDDHRVGPARLTASGRVKAKTVLLVALAFFALAAIAGLAITIRTQHWWFLAVGAACILAAWFYTGGKRPYGYAGLGEVFVFLFFGPVAVIGTTFVQVGAVPWESWLPSIGVGLLACGVLVTNNLRDIDQDRLVGKRTLTVLIGRRASQVMYTLFVLIAFGIAVFTALLYPLAWATLLALLAGLAAILIVWTYRQSKELLVALALTSWTSVAYSALLLWAYVA